VLLKIQKRLAQSGIEKDFIKAHDGKSFELNAVNDFILGERLLKVNKDHRKDEEGKVIGSVISH